MKVTKEAALWAQRKYAEGYSKGEISKALDVKLNTLTKATQKYGLNLIRKIPKAPAGLTRKSPVNGKRALTEAGIVWVCDMHKRGYSLEMISEEISASSQLVWAVTNGIPREKAPLVWPELAAGDVVKYQDEEFVIEKVDKKIHIGTHIVDPDEVKLIRRRIYSEEDDF